MIKFKATFKKWCGKYYRKLTRTYDSRAEYEHDRDLLRENGYKLVSFTQVNV